MPYKDQKNRPPRTPEQLAKHRETMRAYRATPYGRERCLQAERKCRRGVPPEAVAENYLREQVFALGGICPKFIDPANRGAPDRMVMLPGKPVIFVEMKQKYGRLAFHQKRYHDTLRRLGHRVEVLWSKADVESFLLEVTLT